MIGIEIFGNDPERPDSSYAEGKYGDFSSFFMAFIAFFQIMTLSG
jgi:hypothetical protein